MPSSLSKFSVVTTDDSHDSTLYIVLSDEIDVPYFEDHCASDACLEPMEFTNPNAWCAMKAHIVYNTKTDDHCIIPSRNLKPFDTEHPHNGYIPFDQGTSQLRRILGLIALADKSYKDDCSFLRNHITSLKK